MYVYRAELYMGPHDSEFDLGLYAKRADAMAACQDDLDSARFGDGRLLWQNSGVHISRANGHHASTVYYVTRRKVHTTFKPSKK